MTNTDQINLELIVNLLGPEFLEDHPFLTRRIPPFPDTRSSLNLQAHNSY
ncbi:MAG TPA: hypothetical protein VF531_00310 [Bacillota bacterium]